MFIASSFCGSPNWKIPEWGGKGDSLFTGTGIGELVSISSTLSSKSYEGSWISLPSCNASTERQWFALRVKSNFERMTALHLREKGYLEFLPSYTVRSRWSDRVKSIEKPLFPGYVFCNFNPHLRLPILTTPGVLHIVGIGKEPQPIDESEIATVWKTLRSGVSLQPWPCFQIGERVRVERGPLTGVEGVIVRFKGEYRLVLSISLLQRSIAAEIERDWTRPIQAAELGGRRCCGGGLASDSSTPSRTLTVVSQGQEKRDQSHVSG